MYIRNVADMGKSYSCTPFIGRWIKEKNFPVLSISDGKWYFADTPLLREVIEQIPVWIKFLDLF